MNKVARRKKHRSYPYFQSEHCCLICETNIGVHKHHFFKDKNGNIIEYVPQQYHWIPEPSVYLCEPCHNKYENQPPDFFFNPAKRKEIIKAMELFGMNTGGFNSIIVERKTTIIENYPIISSYILSQVKCERPILDLIAIPPPVVKPKSRVIICADCGERFDSNAPRVKYCLKCRLKRFQPKNPTEIKTCLFCGEEFETTRPWGKFCKSPCRNAYHRQRYEEMIKSEKGV